MSTQITNAAVENSTVDSTPIGAAASSTGRFTTPVTSDNSTNAATTAWVRNLLGNGLVSGNGYLILPNGLILQWCLGTSRSGSDNETVFSTNFPIAFPTSCFVVLITGRAVGSDFGEMPVWNATTWSTTSVSYYYERNSDHSGMTVTPIIFAIGN